MEKENQQGLTSVPAEKDELMIVENGQPTFCFSRSNPENSSYGWCRTAGNYYDQNNPSQESEGHAWGFCSKDCHLNDPGQASYGVLRVADRAEVRSV